MRHGRYFGYFSFCEVKGLRDRINNLNDLSLLSVIEASATGGKKKRNGEMGGGRFKYSPQDAWYMSCFQTISHSNIRIK
jgi:hypothetical protein